MKRLFPIVFRLRAARAALKALLSVVVMLIAAGRLQAADTLNTGGPSAALVSLEGAASESGAFRRQALSFVVATIDGVKLRSAGAAHEIQAFLGSVLENVCRLTRVEVRGAYHTKEQEIIRRAGLDGNPWLWQLSSDSIVRKVRTDPWVEKVTLRWRFFPLSLVAAIEEKEPWMIAEMGADTWLISRNGGLIENLSTVQDAELIVESAELPRIDGIAQEGDAGGAAPNARFLYAVRVLKLLDAAGGMPFPAERYSVLPDGGILVQPRDIGKVPQALMHVESFREAKDALSRLRLTLADLERRGEEAKNLDLRFNNQVVVTPVHKEPERSSVARQKAH